MKKNIILTSSFLALSVYGYAQTAAERAQISQTYNQALLSEMVQTSQQQALKEKAFAEAYAKRNNLPMIIQNADGSISELMRIDEGNIPIYYTNKNVNAARSTRVNHLNPGGSLGLSLDGQNMLVSVWDGGAIRTTHQEFGGRITIRDGGNAAGDNHATHVGGTIAAAGVTPAAKGMAPAAQLNSYEWNDDDAEMTAAAAQGLLMSNHSYGYVANQLPDWYFGAYIAESQQWDNILFNAPYYVICKAAGNDGTNLDQTGAIINASPMGGATNAYDKLNGSATSKNVMVVANSQDVPVDNNGNISGTVLINSSSSQGPTDDLRIKPDIAGNGTTVYSSVASSNTAYGTYTGTSMASPNVAGSLILVQQHYKNQTNNYMLGAALKGLALHTADDVGSAGPDASFGWGILNAKRMVETINARNSSALLADRTLNNNTTDTILVQSDGVQPLAASISWYDRGGTVQTSSQLNNSAVKRLVNNLDLRVVSMASSTAYLPWVLTSRSTNSKADNNNDNFERVDAGIVPAGTYAVIISHKGSLTGGNQNYSLIITGRSANVANCTSPSALATSNITTSGAQVSWTGSSTALSYSVEYKKTTETQWTSAYNGTNTSAALSNLSAGTAYQWRVKALCAGNASSSFAEVNFTTLNNTPSCLPPAAPASTVTTNTASLSWTASASAPPSYTVEYKTASASQWISAGNVSGTSTTLNNLAAGTNYNYRISSRCSESLSSTYLTGNFTTNTAPASCQTAYEPNQNIASAYLITAGQTYNANIATSSDVDYYKVTLPYGVYTVSLSGLTHDVDMAIQNASGQNLAVSDNYGTYNEQISGTFSGGTYYIKLYPYIGSDAQNCYTLKVNSGSSPASMSESIESRSNALGLISVYPNPAQNQVILKTGKQIEPGAAIRIYDLLGKTVLTRNVSGSETTIDVSSLSAGQYILSVSGQNGQQHIKFTKR